MGPGFIFLIIIKGTNMRSLLGINIYQFLSLLPYISDLRGNINISEDYFYNLTGSLFHLWRADWNEKSHLWKSKISSM